MEVSGQLDILNALVLDKKPPVPILAVENKKYLFLARIEPRFIDHLALSSTD
jgi:hypothetical protein